MRERIIREQADRACQSFSSFAVPALRPTQKSQISVSILVFRLQAYRFLVLCRSFLVSAELGENNFRGIVLAQLGRNEEAAAEYQEAIRLEPKNKDAYRNLGFLRWTERRYGEAREALTRAVSLFPDDSFAHYYLGRVQLDTQQFTEALRE